VATFRRAANRVTSGEFLWAKTCPDCGLAKPAADYAQNAARPDGLAFYCKPCFNRRSAATYRRRRERQGFAVRQRAAVEPGMRQCAECREIKPESDFARNASQPSGLNCYCKPCNKRRQRASRFLLRYGLTEDALAELIESQGGVCAICQERPAVHVDHDHVTGVVRGVLCFPCNAALGLFEDRIDLLGRAQSYLETSTWQKSRVCTGVFRLTSPRRAARPSPTSSALLHLISSHRAAVTSPPA
jgi:hypothetical protein